MAEEEDTMYFAHGQQEFACCKKCTLVRFSLKKKTAAMNWRTADFGSQKEHRKACLLLTKMGEKAVFLSSTYWILSSQAPQVYKIQNMHILLYCSVVSILLNVIHAK